MHRRATRSSTHSSNLTKRSKRSRPTLRCKTCSSTTGGFGSILARASASSTAAGSAAVARPREEILGDEAGLVVASAMAAAVVVVVVQGRPRTSSLTLTMLDKAVVIGGTAGMRTKIDHLITGGTDRREEERETSSGARKETETETENTAMETVTARGSVDRNAQETTTGEGATTDIETMVVVDMTTTTIAARGAHSTSAIRIGTDPHQVGRGDEHAYIHHLVHYTSYSPIQSMHSVWSRLLPHIQSILSGAEELQGSRPPRALGACFLSVVFVLFSIFFPCTGAESRLNFPFLVSSCLLSLAPGPKQQTPPFSRHTATSPRTAAYNAVEEGTQTEPFSFTLHW